MINEVNLEFVSLGQACQMSFHIKRILGPQKSQIFDNMVVNFDSVISLLKLSKFTCSDFTNRVINYDSRHHWRFRCNKQNVPLNKNWVEGKELIECTKFLMISPHYIDIGQFDREISNFTLMMNRRLDRFKQIIKESSPVFFYCANHQFVPHQIPSSKKIEEFNSLLKQLNPHIKYNLNILIHPEHHYSINNINTNPPGINIYKLQHKHGKHTHRQHFMEPNLNWDETLNSIFKHRY